MNWILFIFHNNPILSVADSILMSSDTIAPGHLPESAHRREKAAGERGLAGPAGPGGKHPSSRGVRAWPVGVCERDGPRRLAQQARPRDGGTELER